MIIQLAIAFVVESLTSFRGSARNFALLGRHFHLSSPSYSSIRQWMLRVGLYVLQSPRENRCDWLFIIDMTLELGSRKCLVVLGISQARWQQLVQQTQGELSYQEMEVLGMEVMSTTKGEVIYQVLEEVTSQVGVPLQIVSDHGSDLKKGIKLYQQAHPKVLVTYRDFEIFSGKKRLLSLRCVGKTSKGIKWQQTRSPGSSETSSTPLWLCERV